MQLQRKMARKSDSGKIMRNPKDIGNSRDIERYIVGHKLRHIVIDNLKHIVIDNLKHIVIDI